MNAQNLGFEFGVDVDVDVDVGVDVDVDVGDALFNFVTKTRLDLFFLICQRSMYPSFWFCTLQFDIMKVVFASALVLASADFAEFKDATEKFTIPMMWRHTTRQTTTCRMLPSERPEFAFRIW